MIREFKFNKNPDISGYYTIRATNKLNVIWEYLGRFKSVDYTKKVLTSQIKNHVNLIPEKAEQIAYTIRQAEQYFITARTADISIKSLLIYYGIVGLAKVLIISGDNEYQIKTTPIDKDHGSHGLSWQVDSNSPDDTSTRDSLSVMEEFCYTKEKGVYPLFRSCFCNTPIPKNQKVMLKQLVSLVGENWKRYKDFFSESPNVYGCYATDGGVEQLDDSKRIIIFKDYYHLFQKNDEETVEETLLRLFPELSQYTYTENNRSYKSNNEITSLDGDIVVSSAETHENFALIQPFPNFKLTELDVYFMIFFILSSLCRYRQDKWHKLTQRLDGNDEFFMIENLFDIVQYKFPLLILRELEQKDYKFIGEVATYG